MPEEAALEYAPPEPEDFEVWPENWYTVTTFDACASQWRWAVGMAAMRTGLDYTAVQAVMDMTGLPAEARREVFDGVRLMEAATLSLQAGAAIDE